MTTREKLRLLEATLRSGLDPNLGEVRSALIARFEDESQLFRDFGRIDPKTGSKRIQAMLIRPAEFEEARTTVSQHRSEETRQFTVFLFVQVDEREKTEDVLEDMTDAVRDVLRKRTARLDEKENAAIVGTMRGTPIERAKVGAFLCHVRTLTFSVSDVLKGT